MLLELRGALTATVFAAFLVGCYSGSHEAMSSGAHGGSYAKPSSGASARSYGSGIAALEAGELDRARRVFGKLSPDTPQDAGAHYLAGLLRVADQDLKGALKFFARAASLDPAMVSAHQQRGVILVRLDRKDDARATLALLEARAMVCKDNCPEAADLRAATAAISVALGQDAPSLASMAANGVLPDPPLRDARWLAPGTPITALLREPGSCVVVPRDENAALAVNIGRVAFRTPMLLGGQARQQGLSCATCHRNGRTNPSFLFPGVSGAPGTADVTTSILSSHRGDGIFNPKPIPDLAGPERKQVISRDPANGKLETFIYGAIVKEFDGPEPPVRVLAGLSAYVRAISAQACGQERALTLATHLEDARVARDAAVGAWAQGDRATTRLMVASARTTLAMINERYAPSALAANRRTLHSADLGLEAIQHAIDQGRADIPVRMIAWRLDMIGWAGMLKAKEAQSLYNPAALKGERVYR